MTNNYTVAFWEANQSTLDAGPNFNIDDSAANIQAALNALNGDAHISQIIIADNGPITLNVAKLTTDATALSKLINQDSSPAQLTVRDTAAHIGNSFATIGASSQVTSVVISDNAVVTLTASQVSNNQQVLGELVNANATAAQVTLKDSAAHIQTDGTLDIVEAHLSTITSIVVSNSAIMTLTASQIANDAGALAIVTNNNSGPVSFRVSDTGANREMPSELLPRVADSSDSDVVRAILSTGADLERRGVWDGTARNHHRQTALLSGSTGDDGFGIGEMGRVRAEIPDESIHRDKVVRMLLEAGADIKARGWSGETPLFSLEDDAVQELLRHHVNLEARDEYGDTALMETVSESIAELLIRAGANVNGEDRKGQTALIKAAERNYVDKLAVLSKAPGVRLDHRDRNGATALMIA